MTYDDTQVLEALEFAAQQDSIIRNDIERAIASHDKDFFARIVVNVLNRLHRTVADLRKFIDSAYRWFKGEDSVSDSKRNQ